jgi:hypothetical protein
MCNPKDTAKFLARIHAPERALSLTHNNNNNISNNNNNTESEGGASGNMTEGNHTNNNNSNNNNNNNNTVSFQQQAANMLRKRNSVIAETRMISYRDMEFNRDYASGGSKQNYYASSRDPDNPNEGLKVRSRFEMMLSLL